MIFLYILDISFSFRNEKLAGVSAAGSSKVRSFTSPSVLLHTFCNHLPFSTAALNIMQISLHSRLCPRLSFRLVSKAAKVHLLSILPEKSFYPYSLHNSSLFVANLIAWRDSRWLTERGKMPSAMFHTAPLNCKHLSSLWTSRFLCPSQWMKKKTAFSRELKLPNFHIESIYNFFSPFSFSCLTLQRGLLFPACFDDKALDQSQSRVNSRVQSFGRQL